MPPPPQPQNSAALAQRLLANQQQAIAALGIADASPLIEAVEKERGSRVVCLTYNESSNEALHFALIQPLEAILSEIGQVPNLDLLLRSTGGVAEVPWRVVSLLREFSKDRLGVIISRFALSGACHIAISADDLIMGPLSVLGPVDPTRDHALLPKDANGKTIPTSVQDLKHCIQFVREQLGEAYPSQNLALIIAELFKHVHPLSIGAIEQTYNLSKMVTKKVLATRKVQLPPEHVNKIVEALGGQFFSHSYMISRAEVESELGLTIVRPSVSLAGKIGLIEAHYANEFTKLVPLQNSAPEPMLKVGAILQTTQSGWVIAQATAKDGTIVADPWLKFR